MMKINVKKLLLFVTVFSIAQVKDVFSKDMSEINNEFLDFIDFEKSTKDSWLNYAKDYNQAKMDLLIKHNNEDFDLWKKSMKEKFDKKEGYTTEYLQEKLNEMVALHEKQAQEWNTLCTNWHNKGMSMHEEKKKELEKFKVQEEVIEKEDLTEIIISE